MSSFLSRLFKREKEVVVPLDAGTIRVNEQIQGLVQENQGLIAELAIRDAKDNQKKETEVQTDYDYELKKRLAEEEKSIRHEKFDGALSLKKFYSIYFRDKRFRENLEFFSNDLKTSLGKFGDFYILRNGDLACIDSHGNVLSHSQLTRHVFYQPGNLLNTIEKMNKIILPFDSNRNVVIDINEEEIPDIKYNFKDQVFESTRESTVKVKDKLRDMYMEMQDDKAEVSRLEKINLGLTKEMDDIKRSNSFLKVQSDSASSQLSQVMSSASQSTIMAYDNQKRISDLTEAKAYYESKIVTYETIVKNMLDRLEKTGNVTLYESAKEELKQDLEFYKKILPKNIINPVQEVKTENKVEQTEQV